MVTKKHLKETITERKEKKSKTHVELKMFVNDFWHLFSTVLIPKKRQNHLTFIRESMKF